MPDQNRKKVLCPIQRKDRSTYWMSVGTAFINHDGSTNVYLDALPSNGKLQIRDLDERDLERIAAARDRSAEPTTGSDDLPF